MFEEMHLKVEVQRADNTGGNMKKHRIARWDLKPEAHRQAGPEDTAASGRDVGAKDHIPGTEICLPAGLPTNFGSMTAACLSTDPVHAPATAAHGIAGSAGFAGKISDGPM